MPSPLIISLVAVFLGIALASGLVASRVVAWATPERRRLRDLASAPTGVLREQLQLVEKPDASLRGLSKALPASTKDLGRLRRRLATAGYHRLSAAVVFSVARIVLPVIAGVVPLLLFGMSDGLMLAIVAAIAGYLLPDLVVARQTRKRSRAIENGLPDALDLIIVCVEAGSSLDQSIVKASDELGIVHRALADELQMVTTEIRAGKPRLEALKNFASRTNVDDVRGLVTMLTQTDRFGTSVAQALRIHAETSRTKRRQRAEERAAKVGVKLVFPLVLCIFPAVYVVCIGPVVVAIYRAMF
jgi:tight adherence protein C